MSIGKLIQASSQANGQNKIGFTKENLKQADETSLFKGHSQIMNDAAEEMFDKTNKESNYDILDDKTGLLKNDLTCDDLEDLYNLAMMNDDSSIVKEAVGNIYKYDSDGDGEYDHTFSFGYFNKELMSEECNSGEYGVKVSAIDDNSNGIYLYNNKTGEATYEIADKEANSVEIEKQSSNEKYSVQWDEDGNVEEIKKSQEE